MALATVASTGNANAVAGELVWRFPVLPPGQEELPAHHGRVALSGDLIITMLGQKLVALKEVDGHAQVEWEEEIDTTAPASPVIGSDEVIRIHGNDGRLHGYDLKGKRAWPPSGVGQPLGYAHPLVDAKNNTYLCSYDGGLLRVDPTGARGQSPFFRTRERFDCTGLLSGDLLYIGGEDGFLHALDLSGRKAKDRWDADAGEGKTDWFINSAIAPLPDGGVVVCCRDEHVYVFNEHGEQQARIEVRGQMLGAPVVDAEGNIFVTATVEQTGKNYGYLACISSSQQKVRWEHKIDRAVESTPVISSSGSILFGDNGGTMHSVSSAGREEWTCSLPSAVRSAGNIYTAEVDGKSVGRVIFGLDDGTLVAISIGETELASDGWPRLLGL